jgi:hypothetical protein
MLVPGYTESGNFCASVLACEELASTDPLHGRWIDAEPFGNLAHSFGAVGLVQCSPNAVNNFGRERRSTRARAFSLRPRKTGAHALLNLTQIRGLPSYSAP